MRLSTSVTPSSKLRGTSVLRLALYLVGRSSLNTRIAMPFGNSRIHLDRFILELLFLILNELRQLFRTAGTCFTLARLEQNKISAASVVLSLEVYHWPNTRLNQLSFSTSFLICTRHLRQASVWVNTPVQFQRFKAPILNPTNSISLASCTVFN